jgi:hypothetical protein
VGQLENSLEGHALGDKEQDRLDVLNREDAGEDLSLHSGEGRADETYSREDGGQLRALSRDRS